MSGRPNMQDIALLRTALEQVAKENDEIERAQKNKAHAELCIENAIQRRNTAAEQVKKLMEAMDCSSPGNFGYENRMFALLTGLREHAEQYGRTHQ